MKDKLLSAMKVAAENVNAHKRLGILPGPNDVEKLMKVIPDAKRFSKRERLHQAMYLTAFGL